MTNQFVIDRHKHFNTSEEEVFNLVLRSGFEPINKTKLTQGYDNEVYEVNTSSGENVIVRIAQLSNVGFRNETWAMERCRSEGVPVPKIYLVDRTNDEKEVMVLEKVRGTPISQVYTKFSQADREKVFANAGAILGLIHNVKVEGFYHRHQDGSWDIASWEREMDLNIRDRRADKELLVASGFTEAEFDKMIDGLVKYKKEFPNQQPVLNHGDFGLEHIFVDENFKITGIIDFGDFQGAPPTHDFAYFGFEEQDLDARLLLAGYPNKDIFVDFDRQLKLHELGLLMGYLAHMKKIGDDMQADDLKKFLKELLGQL